MMQNPQQFRWGVLHAALQILENLPWEPQMAPHTPPPCEFLLPFPFTFPVEQL